MIKTDQAWSLANQMHILDVISGVVIWIDPFNNFIIINLFS